MVDCALLKCVQRLFNTRQRKSPLSGSLSEKQMENQMENQGCRRTADKQQGLQGPNSGKRLRCPKVMPTI